MADQNMDESSQNEQPLEEGILKPECSEKESTQVCSYIYEYNKFYCVFHKKGRNGRVLFITNFMFVLNVVYYLVNIKYL